MDFADRPEHAAFRSEIRRWHETNLPSEICVDDAADQRVAPDCETLEKRIAWQKTMYAAGWGRDFLAQAIRRPRRQFHAAGHL
jgi:hypothetical protein